jgi:S1-C subfamily serine protease
VGLNWIDVVVVLLAGVALLRGWARGLLGQVFEFGGGLAGLLAAVVFGPRLLSLWLENDSASLALGSLIVIAAGLSLGQALGYALGRRFGSVARRAHLGVLDAALGAVFGVAVVLAVYWIIGSLLVEGPIRPLAHSLRTSRVLQRLNHVSAPPQVLAYVRKYLSTADFPQVFAGVPPLSGEPVDLPSGRLARQAVKAAAASTTRIVADGCGGTHLGSGWISAPHTVITNAHVVAGSSSVAVEDRAGSHPGRVVLFDPATDVAALHVPSLEGPSLELETATLASGTAGAVLGYPGSRQGELTATKAAVQARFDAVGRDIYGEAGVRRDIYDLRARVEQGDSGGPFVLPRGAVAGVVFAASTSDAGEGFALTGAEVADEVDEGAGNSTPVSTGECVG